MNDQIMIYHLLIIETVGHALGTVCLPLEILQVLDKMRSILIIDLGEATNAKATHFGGDFGRRSLSSTGCSFTLNLNFVRRR